MHAPAILLQVTLHASQAPLHPSPSPGGSAGGLADAAGGGGTTLPANGVEGTAALAECRVPWCPTLADLQCLEASVGGR